MKPFRDGDPSDDEGLPEENEELESEGEKMEIDTNVSSVKLIAKLRYSEQLTAILDEIHRRKQMPRKSEGTFFLFSVFWNQYIREQPAMKAFERYLRNSENGEDMAFVERVVDNRYFFFQLWVL